MAISLSDGYNNLVLPYCQSVDTAHVLAVFPQYLQPSQLATI